MPKLTSGFLRQFLLPVAAAVTLIAGIVVVPLSWSTHEIDQIAEARQRQIFTAVLDQNITGISKDQEASTVWDDAVVAVRRPHPDLVWFDNNLGVWFNRYYGHDDVIVLNPDNEPIYVMREGKRAALADFEALRARALPLIAKVRAGARRGLRSASGPIAPPAGASDITIVDGRPSIISVKPIVTETGRYPQVAGREFLHISVRHLDGGFLRELAGQYGFSGARFAWTLDGADGLSNAPLRTRRGETIGYVLWEPFSPGTRVMARLTPGLTAALAFIGIIVALLLVRIRRTLVALRASEAHAQHLAFHDTLTGLANRALFQDRLDHALAAVRRGGPAVALFYLDLDRFKAVNDTLGHAAGDQLIRQVAGRLKAATRESDTVVRLGGDEFAIILSGGVSEALAEMLCLRLVETIGEPFDLDGTRVNVGVSIGVAIAPAHAVDRIELSRKADIALYEAKALGRGRHVLFTNAMDATLQRRREIENDLRVAIAAGDQFDLYYQPVHDARTRAATGVEALIRWRHPVYGLMSPATFIPIAEDSGMIELIGDWVLREACSAARNWSLDTLCINVSAVQLRNPDLAKRVLATIAASGMDPRRIELEITETSFVENAAACERNIALLRAQGVRIALDDFGTGYSSFNHLRDFAVDRIKVDRSFVAGIDRREGGSAIIRAIVGLAAARGIAVTAEGVETEAQAEWLTAVGCGSLQGYLLSLPAPRPTIDRQFGLKLLGVLAE
ncbi:bifunctional diguanylate cyclase/phosphodiesterase [Sphingomonas sp. DBB INV C78]|uniref:putative bifunctional diguanylate cyclase/phosphodiesterase n=1 Tax=Sphingomonas sp. DBB INV C78 TaxID=3349434 RepID=UPI0036D2E83F